MSKKLKLILIIGITITLIIGIGWWFYSISQPVAAVVKFNPQTSKEEAVNLLEKYGIEVKSRERIEYENPFFSWLYPFDREGHQGISFETSKFNVYFLKRKMEKEPSVERVIVFKDAYSEMRYYKSFLESLNPELSQ